MRKWISIVFLLMVSAIAMAEQMDNEECIYNQEAFQDMLGQLRAQYPHSNYTEDKSAVTILFKDGLVKVTYGGCEHYGTEIVFVAEGKKKYTAKEAFPKAVELVQRFGQRRIDPKALENLLAQRKYEEIRPGLISVLYPAMDEFTIELGTDSGRSMIIVGFYN